MLNFGAKERRRRKVHVKQMLPLSLRRITKLLRD